MGLIDVMCYTITYFSIRFYGPNDISDSGCRYGKQWVYYKYSK